MRFRTTGESSRRPGLAVVALLALIGFSLGFHNFLSTENLNAIALNSSSLLIAAIGTMALLISGNIDLSIGSQYGLISTVAALVARDTGSAWVAVVVAIGAGAGCGLANGLLVTNLSISPLIVTLAMLAVYRGFAYVVDGGQSVYGLPDSLTSFGQLRIFGVSVLVVVALVAFAAGSILLLTTVNGLRLFAVGGSRTSSALVGLPVARLVVGTYVANGALIGLLSVLSVSQLATGSPVVGVQFEFDVLTAVILGGVSFTGGSGNPVGVVVGVALIGLIDAGLIFAGLEDWWQQIARGTLLLLALAADQVLLRRRRRARSVPDMAAGPAARGRNGDGAVYEATQRLERSGPSLEVRDVTVRFAGVRALDSVSLRVDASEVVCLVGDNGAGKSTLLKAICGAIEPATGDIQLSGEVLRPNPGLVRKLGIETVFQQPALCRNLGAADNLVLGCEPTRWLARTFRVFDHRSAERTAHSYLASLRMSLTDLRRPVAQLSNGEQQMLSILRVLRRDTRLVLLDEPTSALGVDQATDVLQLVRRIAATGRPVIMVTHDVEEVFEVADRVVVLQRGRVIFDGPVVNVTRLELLQLMSGRNRAEAARTVAAITSERQRIERDLHDGAQQHLVNAALMLRLAADQLRDSPNERLAELMASSGTTVRAALAELRDLSHGVYPSVLGERGLAAALDSLAVRSVLPVEVDADNFPRLAGEIELVGYFVVAEAVTNAQKYAKASAIAVSLRHEDDRIMINVADDGVGGADESLGTGIRGLRARVGAIGGSLEVASPVGAGTQFRAVLPARMPRTPISAGTVRC